MQFPDFRSVYGRRCRPAEALAVLPGVGQTSPRSFPQNLPFKLGEDGQQPGHCAPGWCGQVQCLRQRDESDAKMFQFLKGCQQIRDRPATAVQAPHQHDVDLPTAGGLQEFLTSLLPRRTGTDLADLQGNRPGASGGILPHGATLHGQCLLIVRRNAGVQAGTQHFRRSS
jgi:hypothetical protein